MFTSCKYSSLILLDQNFLADQHLLIEEIYIYFCFILSCIMFIVSLMIIKELEVIVHFLPHITGDTHSCLDNANYDEVITITVLLYISFHGTISFILIWHNVVFSSVSSHLHMTVTSECNLNENKCTFCSFSSVRKDRTVIVRKT